jgi:hypothetical protein
MKVQFLEGKIIGEELIQKICGELEYNLPNDFLESIRVNDGAYLSPNNILEGVNATNVNNLVSFDEADSSFILDILEDLDFRAKNIIPIAEDPFGNIFGFHFLDKDNSEIVFYDSEMECSIKICNTYTEFISLIY